MKLLFISLLFLSNFAYADENYCEWLNEYVKELQVGNLTVIKGCKGEHCAGMKDRVNSFYIGLDPPVALKASNPFTFYSNLETLDLIARYSAGFMAKPTEQQVVIRDRGEYIIEKIKHIDRFDYCPSVGTPLKIGDKIDTPIDIGEGSIVVRNKGRLVSFGESFVGGSTAHGIGCFHTGNCEYLKLKVIREAKIEDWMTLEIDGVVGFTMDHPFLNAHHE
ncbi:hypothetical protein N9444_10370 [Gammaproteobacteria bacterium]|nr:hypothetical protein [Gammaproteobacteria bacterium]